MANDLIDILKKIQGNKLSILQLSKQMGVNSNKLYSYVSGRAKPKMDDFIKMQNWYALVLKEELVPGSTNFIVEDLNTMEAKDVPHFYNEILPIEALQEEIVQLKEDKLNLNMLVKAQRKEIQQLKQENEYLREELAKYKPPEKAKNFGARTA